MKKRTINMKKPLAIAAAAAMMLGICPTAAPVNAADSDYKYVYASLDWKLTSSREASAMRKQRQNIFIKNCVSHLLIPICWQFVLRGN